MREKKYNLTVSQKLILPLIILMLGYLTILSVGIYKYSYQKIVTLLDSSVEHSTESIHAYIDFAIHQSIKSNLRGRVEDTLASIRYIYSQIGEGKISPREAKAFVRNDLLSKKVGESGYYYVLDSTGTLIIHPSEVIVGTELTSYDFVRDQISLKNGYLEYEWQNPGESAPREKALYMLYFPPWDWIVTVSAYRDEVVTFLNQEVFESSFIDSASVNYGYNFFIDQDGNFISHPQLKGRNIYELSNGQDLVTAFEQTERSDELTGQFEYLWKDQNQTKGTLHRAYYHRIPELGLTIVSSYVVDKYRKPVTQMVLFLLPFSFVSIVLLTVIMIRIIRRIIAPLSRMTNRILKSEFMDDINTNGYLPKDEIALTGQLYEVFYKRITEKQQMLEKAYRENEILAQFPNNLSSPVLRVDGEGYYSYMNTAAESVLDSVLDIEQNRIDGILLEQFLENVNKNDHFELFILGSSFSVYIVEILSSNEMYLHFHDLTIAHRFKTLQNIWKSVLDSSIEGITITDKDGYIERINDSFTRITGYTKADAIGKHTSILKSEKHDSEFYREMWKNLNESGNWQGEIWNRKKTGEVYPEWLNITSFTDMYSGRTKYMAIFHDISDIYAKNEELAHLSSHDALTDLPNRISFHKEIAKEIENSKSSGGSFWVMLLDIHGFSQINDHIGQAWGDKFLLEFAGMLRKAVNKGDELARLGSDDFGVLIKGSDVRKEHTQILSRLNSRLSKSITLNGREIRPVVNIGISVYPDDGDDSDALVRKAGIAVLLSKAGMPGGYRFFSEDMETLLQKKFDLEIDVKRAIENDEFTLFYQPKAEILSGEIAGLEALVRWIDPRKGIVSPNDFIPVLEETGLIIDVGKALIRQACRMIHRIQDETGRGIPVSVNISAIQFSDPEFLLSIDRILSEEEVDVSLLEFEITENIAAMDITDTVQILNELKKRGIAISIDDFGTGYSSLSYLINMPFDVLKIDSSFVRPLPQDESRLALVQSIIGLAKNYRKKTVAEGVETKEQMDLLRESGCDYIQGYFLSKPVNADETVSFLKKNTLTENYLN